MGTHSKATFKSNIKSKQRLNSENLHYLLQLPKIIGKLHLGRVVGKGGDVLVSLRTEFLFGVPCRAACNIKCVCLCVCMYVCVCVCVFKCAQGEGRDLHLPNDNGRTVESAWPAHGTPSNQARPRPLTPGNTNENQ